MPLADPRRIHGGAKLLLDTCVYVDTASGRLPAETKSLPDRRVNFHSAVSLAELTLALDELAPDEPRYAERRAFLRDAIARMARDDRIVSPDDQGWALAGALAGLLSRTQGFGREQRRKALADCLIYVTAMRNGLILLTANVAEFDLLHQLLPEARVAFYRPL